MATYVLSASLHPESAANTASFSQRLQELEWNLCQGSQLVKRLEGQPGKDKAQKHMSQDLERSSSGVSFQSAETLRWLPCGTM